MVEFWNGKKVLVTGANGFIGAWLCRKLIERNAAVTGLVHQEKGLLEMHGIQDKVECIKGDVQSIDALQNAFKKSDAEICFHLAAKSSTRDAAKDLAATFNTNVMGTLNALAAAKEADAAVVFTSTVKAYGGFTDSCFSEEQQLLGTTAYATSKIAAETICRMFAKRFGLSIGIARPANVFGAPDNNFTRLVPGAIKNLLEGKPPRILGKGESMLDMVYVEDVAEGLLLLGEKVLKGKVQGEAFNFGSGESHSVKEVIGEIAKILGKNIEPNFHGEEMLCKECLCTEKSEKVLGWKAKHSFEEGLKKAIKRFKGM